MAGLLEEGDSILVLNQELLGMQVLLLAHKK